MTNTVKFEPAKIYVKDVEWTTDDIVKLKEAYGDRPFAEFPKTEIRQDPMLKKALASEVLVVTSVQKGPSAILYMTKVGQELMAMV